MLSVSDIVKAGNHDKEGIFMKWSSKGLACLLAVGLLLVSAGCSGRPQKPDTSTPEVSTPEISTPESSATATVLPEASALYETSMKRMEAEKGFAGSMEIEYTYSTEGVTVTIPMKVTMEASEKDGESLLHMLIITKAMGQTMNMEMWQDEEYLYMSSMGQKIKQPLSEEAPGGQDSMEELDSLGESLREGAVVTAEEDGYTITARLPGNKLTGVLQSLMDMSGNGSLEGLADISYSDMEFSMTVDKDSILRKVSLSGEITGQVAQPDVNDPTKMVEVEALYQYKIAVSLDKVGDVTVTLPEDLDSFVEMPTGVSEEVVSEVLESLFDENGQPVENFNEIYEQLAAKYGYEQVDQALSMLLGSQYI